MEVCKMCNKAVGTNKFYTPLLHKENTKISKFNISDSEKRVLARKKGWKRVNQDMGILKSIKKRVFKEKKQKEKEKTTKIKEREELNKNFVEGLK